MLPYIVFSWIGVIVCLIMVIFLPIDWFGPSSLRDMIINNMHFDDEKQKKQFIESFGVFYGVTWAIFTIGAGLHAFIFNNFRAFF